MNSRELASVPNIYSLQWKTTSRTQEPIHSERVDELVRYGEIVWNGGEDEDGSKQEQGEDKEEDMHLFAL